VPTGDIAAARNALRNGRSLTFGFDLTGAPAVQTGPALQAAVAFVTPTVLPLAPLDVAGVEIDLANSGPAANFEVHEVLPTSLNAFLALPDTWINPTGTLIEWTTSLSAGGTTKLRYFARLPDAAGVYTTNTIAFYLSPTGPQQIKTVSLDLSVTSTRAGLEAAAQAAVSALPTRGHDGSVRREVQAKLLSVQSRVVTRRADAEENIEDLLEAVESAKRLTTVDPTPLRLALDELIRYWEARWYAF
jgi:hypothetical protein